MKKFLSLIGLLALLVAFTGCNTTQQRTVYNTLYSVHAVTEASVDGYFLAAAKGITTTNGIPQVAAAYNKFQVSFIVALDAAQYNTNALAPASLQAESQDVISLVTTFYKGGK